MVNEVVVGIFIDVEGAFDNTYIERAAQPQQSNGLNQRQVAES